MRLLLTLLAPFCIVATPAHAAGEAIGIDAKTRWGANQILAQASAECKVPLSQISLDRFAGGESRLQTAPSLNKGQVACVTNIVQGLGVRLRN